MFGLLLFVVSEWHDTRDLYCHIVLHFSFPLYLFFCLLFSRTFSFTFSVAVDIFLLSLFCYFPSTFCCFTILCFKTLCVSFIRKLFCEASTSMYILPCCYKLRFLMFCLSWFIQLKFSFFNFSSFICVSHIYIVVIICKYKNTSYNNLNFNVLFIVTTTFYNFYKLIFIEKSAYDCLNLWRVAYTPFVFVTMFIYTYMIKLICRFVIILARFVPIVHHMNTLFTKLYLSI